MEAGNVQNVQNAQNPPALLMLDEPRVIAVRDCNVTYTFHFRRIQQADWERYFNGLYVASSNEGTAQLNTTDLNTAGIELFESTLVKAEGYKNAMDRKEDFWKIPPRHSILVSWLLRSVCPSTFEDDSPLDCDSIETRIDALWSQSKPGEDTAAFKGLVHRFTPITVDQKKRFMRRGAINKVVGGSRKGTTIYSMKHKLMLELYDQLIQSVEGYGIAGKPLEGVEQIRREMDGYHKTEAIAQLFNVGDSQPESASAEAA
jgi:hypothetical protein